MRGFVHIPASIHSKLCKECGSRAVIAWVGDIGYVVKCSANNSHYQTMPGLIDIADWNRHNTIATPSVDFTLSRVMAW